ncbi:MAG: aminopeptidase N [Dichotomicrobium sp.]
MKTEEPRTIYLKDYKPSPYLIEHVELDVSLAPENTRVRSRLSVAPNPATQAPNGPLELKGEQLELHALTINGNPINDYTVDDAALTIPAPPDGPFEVEIETSCNPQANEALEGLYRSNGMYCTQCEPEGFRRITYFLDRPDVLARYRVRIEADKDEAPVLLSNGNLVDHGDLDAGRHFAVWEDPFPKPSYLFALVGGKLACVKDTFITRSGRTVDLRIYVEPGKEGRCNWAMESLKTAMRWDEERFGLEYDLDIFMIVAVSDFNMGAMENKGLNIFNDKLILARPDIATDDDYEAIEAVIAHEYFHNWTGNRITCRDWFQLCLKEGLTVFRDQEFTADQRSRPVKRIRDVRLLRARQFTEDAGPLAHPVRPASFVEINNFYTLTVYEKGAELCRMLHTMLGEDGFQAGMKLYFERHDGQAVTVEDFISAMADANDRDLSRFMRWYNQAGTPELVCRFAHNAAEKTATLHVTQVLPPSPGQPEKEPLPIPLRMGLVGPGGEDMPLRLKDSEDEIPGGLLTVTEREQEFEFTDVAHRPIPSLLRGFSAPVKLSSPVDDADLDFLMRHDRDLFNRWQAAQTQAMKRLVAMARPDGHAVPDVREFALALGPTLTDESLEPAYRAAFAVPPSEFDIAQEIGSDVDPGAVHEARRQLRATLGRTLHGDLTRLYEDYEVGGDYQPDPESVGRRSLRNTALALLAADESDEGVERARAHFDGADNMTDSVAALRILASLDRPERDAALDGFYQRWKDEQLVLDKWFAIQAQSTASDTLDRAERLRAHPAFSIKNPNRVRALFGALAHGNPLHFHSPDGRGYAFIGEAAMEIDSFNPMIASRLASAFSSWRMLEPGRRGLAQNMLERIAAKEGLSRDTSEVVGKMLG